MSNAVLFALFLVLMMLAGVLIPLLVWTAVRLYQWLSKVNALASKLDLYLQADAERMKLLNEAIVKLASEASASRESVDQVRALITSATSAKEEDLMHKYNSAFNELREQGMDEREAHISATEYMSSIGEI